MLKLFYDMPSIEIERLPSFRELIPYAVRRSDGYGSAFSTSIKQQPYSCQICNAYFLDLDMVFVSNLQALKDEKKNIEAYKKMIDSGTIGSLALDVGKLETEVINKKKDAEALKIQLDSFRVHPQYNDIAQEANRLTKNIHDASDTLILRQQQLTRYEQTIQEEAADISLDDVERIYEEVEVIFSSNVKKQLKEVAEFHKILLSNRKNYLSSEILRLKRDINELQSEIKKLMRF